MLLLFVDRRDQDNAARASYDAADVGIGENTTRKVVANTTLSSRTYFPFRTCKTQDSSLSKSPLAMMYQSDRVRVTWPDPCYSKTS